MLPVAGGASAQVLTASPTLDPQAPFLRWMPDDRLLPIIGIINHLAHVEWRWIDHVPLRIGKYLLAEGEGRIIALSDEECDRLQQAAHALGHPDLWLFIAFGLNCGMRHDLPFSSYSFYNHEVIAFCDMVTKEAPAHNVLVAQATGTACGRSSNEGEALWAPGTLTYVGGNETPSAFEAVMLQAIADNPGPQKVGILTGPNLHPITVSFDKALADGWGDLDIASVHDQVAGRSALEESR